MGGDTTQWELMENIANASNNNDNQTVAQLILDNDFDDKPQAFTMAISAFSITPDNVEKHFSAAVKLTSAPEPKTFRESFRLSLIKDLMTDIR